MRCPNACDAEGVNASLMPSSSCFGKVDARSKPRSPVPERGHSQRMRQSERQQLEEQTRSQRSRAIRVRFSGKSDSRRETAARESAH